MSNNDEESVRTMITKTMGKRVKYASMFFSWASVSFFGYLDNRILTSGGRVADGERMFLKGQPYLVTANPFLQHATFFLVFAFSTTCRKSNPLLLGPLPDYPPSVYCSRVLFTESGTPHGQLVSLSHVPSKVETSSPRKLPSLLSSAVAVPSVGVVHSTTVWSYKIYHTDPAPSHASTHGTWYMVLYQCWSFFPFLPSCLMSRD